MDAVPVINILRTTEETAGQLTVHPVTLRKARINNSLDLPYIRIGRTVRYSQEDIDAFLERHREGGAI